MSGSGKESFTIGIGVETSLVPEILPSIDESGSSVVVIRCWSKVFIKVGSKTYQAQKFLCQFALLIKRKGTVRLVVFFSIVLSQIFTGSYRHRYFRKITLHVYIIIYGCFRK